MPANQLSGRQLVIPALTSLVALSIYLLTLAPDLTWAHYGGDGPELITASVTLGVPHPPGYPTYVLAGKLFSLLPLGPIAFRFNLFSALCMALAAGGVSHLAGMWIRRDSSVDPSPSVPWWRLATGLTFSFMPLVWSQALVTEVYALNLLVLVLFLGALLGGRSPWLIGLLLGLSVTTHLTSLFMLPMAFVLVPREQWARFLLSFLAGLAPFLLLPSLARGSSPVVWGRPDTWSGWWWLVSGEIYRPNLFGLPHSLWSARLVDWSRQLMSQLAWIGVPLLLVGLSEGWAQRKKLNLLFLSTAFLYASYSFFYNTYDAVVFLLPALLLLSIVLTEIMVRIGDMALLLPFTLLMLHFGGLDLHGDRQVRLLAASALAEAPPHAILLTAGDRSTFPLWYLHYVEEQRSDLIVVDRHLFNFDWYRQRLRTLYPALTWPANAEDLLNLEEIESRPICRVSLEGVTLPVTNSCTEVSFGYFSK